MRYLTVKADYRGTGINDDFEGPITAESLGLPPELAAKISRWLEDYQRIIPLGMDERAKRQKEIEELDNVGIRLAREVKAYFGASAKMRYFSEDKLRRILI